MGIRVVMRIVNDDRVFTRCQEIVIELESSLAGWLGSGADDFSTIDRRELLIKL